MMTMSDWLELLPYIGGAIGVLINGAFMFYNARHTAYKNSIDAHTNSVQAVGALSLNIAQQADTYYKACMDRVDALTLQLAASMALNMRYSKLLSMVASKLDDVARRHALESYAHQCDYSSELDARLRIILEEVNEALVDINAQTYNGSVSPQH